jgi:hypothetical protein
MRRNILREDWKPVSYSVFRRREIREEADIRY